MNAYKDLFHQQLTDKPQKSKTKKKQGRSKHLGWVFFTNDPSHKPKSVRTYQSLYLATKEYRYFTPNTFFHSKSRDQLSLRWINAMSIDYDVKNEKGKIMTLPELMDLINSVGLPSPTMIVQTPSKGFHIHWYLKEPRRCDRNNKIVQHYKRILGLMIEELGADNLANGPERYFRVPNSEGCSIVYQSNERTDFDVFCDWYSIEVERRQEEQIKCSVKPGFNMFEHPALKKLLEGVEEGSRDNTCYTLALAYKSIGLNQEETEAILQKWNQKNSPALSFIQVHKKVKSAFKPGSPLGASSKFISELSGIPFTYQVWEQKKERNERIYSHYEEWEEDVLAFIRFKNGKITGSQRLMADQIRSSVNPKQKIPYSTFKIVLERLVAANKIIKHVEGKGRGAITTLYLQEEVANELEASVQSEEGIVNNDSKNGLDSYTPIDKAVGGVTPGFPGLFTVPTKYRDLLSTYGFSSEGFLFKSWEHILLAFRDCSMPTKGISHSIDLFGIIEDAFVLSCASLVPGELIPDSFYVVLSENIEHLIEIYRNDSLAGFIRDLESLSLEDLDILKLNIEKKLMLNLPIDRVLLEDQLIEIDCELSARVRRANRQPSLTMSLLNKFINND